LCDEQKPTQRATRSGIVSMDKAFGANFTRLRQHRAATLQKTQPLDDLAETDIADRNRRHQSQIEPKTQEATAVDREQSETNTTPSTWPTAAQMPGLNRQARRALDRQTRKRDSGLSRPGIMPDRNEPTATPSATTAG
jgi:hypothetical protein